MDRLSLNPKVSNWFDCWYLDAYQPASVFQIYEKLRYVTVETAGIYMQLAFFLAFCKHLVSILFYLSGISVI